MIVLPALPRPHADAWSLLLDLTQAFSGGWALVGGLMVHAHCYDRGVAPPRVTDDADIGVDLSAIDQLLPRLTDWIEQRGYHPGRETETGRAHRWTSDGVSVDVLVPEHQADARSNVTNTGRPVLASPGLKEAVASATVTQVEHSGRSGSILLPTLLRSIVAKCAALEIAMDPHSDRHVSDVVTMSTLLRPADREPLSAKDRRRMGTMLTRIDRDPRAWAAVDDGEDGVAVLRLLADS